jgi:hypothetical protein
MKTRLTSISSTESRTVDFSDADELAMLRVWYADMLTWKSGYR